MSTVLLDTTVASLLHPKKENHPLRTQYESHMRGQILALSFQSVAELWSWAEENGWGRVNIMLKVRSKVAEQTFFFHHI